MDVGVPDLQAGERVMRAERLHPIVFGGALTMAALIGVATGFVLANNELAPDTRAQIIAVGAVLAVCSVLPTAGRWWRSRFAVTDRRFVARVGWLRPQLLALGWSEVDAVEVTQSLLGRLCGYGTLRLAAGEGAIGFPHVAGAVALHAAARERLPGRGRGRS